MTPDAKTASPAETADSPFNIPIFRAVWAASVTSNFGGLIQSVGAAWMMTSLVRSPKMVALVQSSAALAFMLLPLLAGAAADNLDRRKVMLTAQFFMLTVSATLTVFAWQGWLTPWILLSFTFLIGCGTAMNSPAWHASVGDIVPRAQLPAAVAINSMGFNAARTVGPAIGGAIVAAVGAAGAFLANTLSYFALIFVLLRWRPNIAPRLLPREGILVAIGAGLRYVSMSPNLRIILARSTVFGVAANALPSLMPVVARNQIGGGPLTYGIMLVVFGIGSVTTAFANRRLRQHLSTELTIRWAAFILSAGTAVVALSPYLALTLVALFFAGGGWMLALSTFNATVQLASPRWVVARALSIYQMVTFGGMAIGGWALGSVAEQHGVAAGLLAGAAVQIIVVLIGFVLPLPQVQGLNLDPLSQWTEPETTVPLEHRSGPVVITIDHRIEPHNITAFLAAMTERRRIRRRDGASGWTLLRDLHDPELWVERYHVATWLDYIRHNHRRTQADAENGETLRQLQKNGEPLHVRRMLERQTGSLPIARDNEPDTIVDPMTDR